MSSKISCGYVTAGNAGASERQSSVFLGCKVESQVWNALLCLNVQVLLCVFLFSVCLFLTTVIAKVLGRYFHKAAFFEQMTDTLKKVLHPVHA